MKNKNQGTLNALMFGPVFSRLDVEGKKALIPAPCGGTGAPQSHAKVEEYHASNSQNEMFDSMRCYVVHSSRDFTDGALVRRLIGSLS